MSSRRNCLLAASLILLIVVSGCGGSSSGFDPNNVTVSISPPTATVAEGGQVTLQATVSGCSSCAPAVTWSIRELQTNGASGAQCNWQSPTPPAGPCPDGTIEEGGTPPFVTVTFHAPSSPGTIHIIAEWTLASNPPVTKDGTAAITTP